ncbi:MAG: hypothetical protein Q4G09_03030 [Clostridia bacterium]|nr:hypothetical protein [Clostridia bacterium]
MSNSHTQNKIYCSFEEDADNISNILEKSFIDYLKIIENKENRLENNCDES